MPSKNLTDLFANIKEDTEDIVSPKLGYQISTVADTEVPNDDDKNGLTFKSGEVKKAKEITTCVLYIDIRNSTNLSNKHHKDPEKMGKLYSAFVNAMADVADHHGAFVRNIIGDRVMIVFPAKNCFTNAVDCAISCNQACHNIIDKELGFDSFKFGIGIDYGKMTVIKVGIPKSGKERSDYKGLVWIGKPANIASKLTDIANKTIMNKKVKLKIAKPTFMLSMGFNSPPHRDCIVSVEDFMKNVSIDDVLKVMQYEGNRVLEYKFLEQETSYPPILMTQAVFEEFKKLNPERTSIRKNLWSKQDVVLKQYDKDVYGGDVIWEL